MKTVQILAVAVMTVGVALPTMGEIHNLNRYCAWVAPGFAAPMPAQETKAAPPPSTPSPAKALVYIYRVGRFTGSAAHDHLYVNGVYLAYLKNDEYAGTEVSPGTVVVTGLPEMYTVDIFTAAGAAVNDATKKMNERIRFEAEAGKTYYLKWTSSTMATGIKVTQMAPAVGAKERSKLHLSKRVEQPEAKEQESAR
jgi:hypothetical protein